jgi:hypothetical protein
MIGINLVHSVRPAKASCIDFCQRWAPIHRDTEHHGLPTLQSTLRDSSVRAPGECET